MDLQHFDVPIDRLDQADVLCQAMHRTDASRRESSDPVAVLVPDVARPIHRSRLRRPRPRPQPTFDSCFASRHVLMSTRLHSKCPSWCQSFWLPAVKLCSEVRTFRGFRLHAEPQTRLYWG